MKVTEIINRAIVREGMVEPNLLLTVKNVIQRGRADNTFEFIVIARLLQLLKQGEFYKTSNPLFDPNLTTSKELLELLRSLPPAEITALAAKLWGLLQLKDEDALYTFANPTQEYLEYLKWIQAREAND